MTADRRGHRRKVAVHDLDETLRGHPFADAGKSFDVAEHDGHDAALTFSRKRRPLDESFDDARIDIFAEGLAQAFLETQLLDHLVERGRQVADFVLRGHDECFVELAGLDRPGAFQQSPYWMSHSSADQHREHQTQYSGEPRQDGSNERDLMLLACCQFGIRLQQGQHVRPDSI
jgi:hypothetical protein